MSTEAHDETAMQELRRMVNVLNFHDESLLDELPTMAACVEFAVLVTKTYGVDDLSGVEEVILENGSDPKPLVDFVKKHKLPWNTAWTKHRKV
jgi:hypothetical protein